MYFYLVLEVLTGHCAQDSVGNMGENHVYLPSGLSIPDQRLPLYTSKGSQMNATPPEACRSPAISPHAPPTFELRSKVFHK
jgi:hypothetical protein